MTPCKKHSDESRATDAGKADEPKHAGDSFEHASGARSLKEVIDAQYHRPDTPDGEVVRPRGRSTRLFPETPAE